MAFEFFKYIFKAKAAVDMGRIPPPLPVPSFPISTSDAALRISVVYACVRILSETIATLPKKVYDSKTNKEIKNHPVENLINFAPNEYTDAVNFWNFICHGVYLKGNGHAAIERNGAGQVRLIPLAPTQVSGVRLQTDPATGIYQKIYSVSGRDIADANMLHFMSSAPDPSGLMGLSIIERYALQSVQHLHSIEEYSTNSFKRGANVSGVYKVPQTLAVEDRKAVRKELDELHSGMNAGGRFAIADGGADITAITLSPDDTKFLASRNWGVEEICRWFGVPLHLVQNGNQQSYNSNESNSGSFQTYTLLPQCMRIEQQLNRKLFPARDCYIAFDFQNLIRPSVKDRFEANVKACGGPFATQNEIRKLENLPAIEGGDTLLKPLNMGGSNGNQS